MTNHELIKLLRSDAHYLANDEIASNAAISHRISLAADYLMMLEAQLVKNEKERQKQADTILEERGQKYAQISVIDSLKKRLATVSAEERPKGKWIDFEHGIHHIIEKICSECGNLASKNPFTLETALTNFCPNCGADMRKENTDV